MTENYMERIENRNKIRYYTIIIYIALIITYAILGFIWDFNYYGIVSYLVIIFGGFILMLSILIYPYFYPIETPIVEDREIIDLTEDYTGDTYYEKVVLTLLYWLTIPFALIYVISAIWNLIIGVTNLGYISTGASLFFIIILVLFDKIEIVGDNNYLYVKFGPFNEKIKISEIISVRPVQIKPIRTYLGYGKRIGTDGTIGYISGSSTGVKLDFTDKKKLVLSSHEPNKLVAFVRKMKANSNKIEN